MHHISTNGYILRIRIPLIPAAQPLGTNTVRSSLGINDEFESINIRAGNDAGSTTFSNSTTQYTSPFGIPVPTAGWLAGLAMLGMVRRRG